MKKICFFDSKPYDKNYFNSINKNYGFDIEYFETKLNTKSAVMTAGFDGAIAFVNDKIDSQTIDILFDNNVKILAMRCAGYNNIDFKSAYGKVHIVRVPAYSPYAVAEHTMALLLALNRKVHRAYNRVREYNFSLNGLLGFDIHGKTVGVAGTGRIGRVFIDICRGFGANVIAYDPYPAKDSDINYVSFEELCRQSDIISLHCPLTKETFHMVNKDTISLMKKGVIILNTSRGSLIASEDLLEALKNERVSGAGLDVYEEESDFFYEDMSYSIIKDNVLTQLISMPNVVLTSHQAFFTDEALTNIAGTTMKNLDDYFNGRKLENEICYQCTKFGNCNKGNRCF